MSANKTSVTLRLMTERDLPMLHDWLNSPHIIEWWGGEEERPTLEDVLRHYLPRVLAQGSVTPYIAMLGEEPIGYAQSYVALGIGDGPRSKLIQRQTTIELSAATRRRALRGKASSPHRTALPSVWFKQGKPSRVRAVLPNPSFKRSANGRPPSPGWWYAVHFHQPGLGALPLSPA